MSRVTSKLQVTVPKALAERYGIRPGDDIRFEGAGEHIRVIPAGMVLLDASLDVEERLRLFDAATDRQRQRESGRPRCHSSTRGWTREGLYENGRSCVD